MPSIVVKNSRILALAVAVFYGLNFAPSVQAQTTTGGSTVGAVVCAAGSTIVLNEPVSDSVVTQPEVELSGTVDQASQIEVYIDNVFDSIISLSMGQAVFNGSVQLSAGTHTVKVVAVHTCSGVNGTASSVITYTPPSSNVEPSDGSEVPTEVSGGVTISPESETEKLPDEQPHSLLPEVITMPFERALEWLNVNTSDSSEGKSLSFWRAAAIGGGLYLLVVGGTGMMISAIVGTPTFSSGIFATVPPTTRRRIVAWALRFLGLAIVGAALLL